MSDAYLAALEHELEGYKTAGKTDRVKAVEAEIARVKKSASAPVETADAPKRRGRPRKADIISEES
jgi:hypothetical protein